MEATGGAGVAPLSREHRFHLAMAWVIAATVIVGFGSFALRGFVDVRTVPLWVHIHGATVMAWILLFLTQNILISRGRRDLHRQLGWSMAGLACVMVPLGVFTSVMAVHLGRTPPFFTPGIFLVLGPLDMLGFALLTCGGIALRRRSDWHKRLMLCGTIAMLEPAWGRLLPMPLLGPWGGACATAMQLLYVGAGMIFDLRTRGRVHPAYGWGISVIVARCVLVETLGRAPFVVAAAAAVAAW